MAKQPKRIQAWTGDRENPLPLAEAVKLVKDNAKAKFDESIEIAVNLGVDPRHADQQVRGVLGEDGDANVTALIDALNKAKPSGAKGTFVKRISLSSTMGPGFKIDPASLGA